LYVVKEPNGKGKGHKEWQETKNGTSWKAQLQTAIDKAIRGLCSNGTENRNT